MPNSSASCVIFEGLSGADFDREYTQTMVGDHEKAVDLFQKASKSDLDPALRQFAIDTVPTLLEHLRRARDLLKQVAPR